MTAPEAGGDGPIGIVALGGRLPSAIAESVRASGGKVFVIGLEGVASDAITAFDHAWVPPFKVGMLFGALRRAGCRRILFAGTITRPRLSDIRIDLRMLRALPVLFWLPKTGDDSAVSRLTRMFEAEGFEVTSVADVAPRLVACAGPLGALAPSAADHAAIRHGRTIQRGVGGLDIGQAVVVEGTRVLAVEAAEGTTRMVERIAELRGAGRLGTGARAGILIKGPKPQQELRNDMPVVGAETVAAAIASGLRGIAYAAGGVLLVDAAEMVARADAAGLFLFGFEDEAP